MPTNAVQDRTRAMLQRAASTLNAGSDSREDDPEFQSLTARGREIVRRRWRELDEDEARREARRRSQRIASGWEAVVILLVTQAIASQTSIWSLVVGGPLGWSVGRLWQRWLLSPLAAGFVTAVAYVLFDVLTSGFPSNMYRAIWLALGLGLAAMLATGARLVRQGEQCGAL